jgi:hypothetical protein
MKRTIITFIAFFLLLAGCGQGAKRDSARLDSLLASSHIDKVEFMSPDHTNEVVGQEAQKLAASLDQTNRVSSSDWTKDQVQSLLDEWDERDLLANFG